LEGKTWTVRGIDREGKGGRRGGRGRRGDGKSLPQGHGGVKDMNREEGGR